MATRGGTENALAASGEDPGSLVDRGCPDLAGDVGRRDHPPLKRTDGSKHGLHGGEDVGLGSTEAGEAQLGEEVLGGAQVAATHQQVVPEVEQAGGGIGYGLAARDRQSCGGVLLQQLTVQLRQLPREARQRHTQAGLEIEWISVGEPLQSEDDTGLAAAADTPWAAPLEVHRTER